MKKIKAVSFILFLLLIAAMIASCNKPEDLITITFETFEGSEVEPLKCNGKTVISMPAQPEKTGYEFGGWYTDPEFNNPFVYSTLLDNPVNEDITVYAKWIPIKFTVTFVSSGATVVSGEKKQVVDYGKSAQPPVFERKGYTFAGWDKPLDNIKESVIISALYTPNKYAVTLDKQGGQGGKDTVVATFASPMPEAEAPAKASFSFGGYYTEENGGGDQYYDGNMESAREWDLDQDTTLYAKWYNLVTFDKQGGTGGDDYAEAVLGLPMPAAQSPEKKGYTFEGYFTQPNGQGTAYYDHEMESLKIWEEQQPITLYAHWTANDYTVVFDMQDGDLGTESITVTYDMPMPEIVKPYKSGYAFLGYFSKINGEGERYYDEDAEGVKDWDIDQNTALYAHWDFLEGAQGILYEIVYERNVAKDEYKVVGYEGGQSEVQIPLIHQGKPVTQIADRAFIRNMDIVKVAMTDNIVKIGEEAFAECVNLEEVRLPLNLLELGKKAFNYCLSLTSANLPDSLKNIEEGMFLNCVRLKNVRFGQSLNSICASAFANCLSLESVEFPINLLSVGEDAFSDCIQLTDIAFNENLNLINDRAFYNCKNLNSPNFPDSLLGIGSQAFYNCNRIQSVTLPRNINYVGQNAFHASYFRSVFINNQHPFLFHDHAFDNYYDTPIYFYVPEHSLSEYKTDEGWTEYRERIFAREDIQDGCMIIDNELVQYVGGNGSVTLSHSITSIRPYAFCGVTSDVAIPEGGSVTVIGQNAFAYYLGQSLSLAPGIVDIEANAFSHASNLTEITLPYTVASIDFNAFENAENLNSVVVLSHNPPQALNAELALRLTIYVLDEYIDNYINDEVWKNFDVVALD